MKKITLNKKKYHLEDEIEAIVEGEVKPIGNGAMILVPKKYIGKKGYFLIAKD
jgi:putative transposon-encoded protein